MYLARLEYIEKLLPKPDQLGFFNATADKCAVQVKENRPSHLSVMTVDIKP